MCVRFFNVPPETKRPWRQTPSRKKKAVVFTTVTTDAYQDQLNAGFSKECENTLKYIREFHRPVSYKCDISTPWYVTLNETDCDWLCDTSVKRPHGWTLVNESCHLFQTFSHQSGYARLVEEQNDRPNVGMTMEHLTAGRCNHFHIMLKNKSNWFFKCIWMTFFFFLCLDFFLHVIKQYKTKNIFWLFYFNTKRYIVLIVS